MSYVTLGSEVRRRHARLCGVIFLLGILSGVGAVNGSDLIDLDAYQWKKRLLLIFAPSEENGAYQHLTNQFPQHTKVITERDLLVFRVFEKGESRLDAAAVLSREQALSLRNRFSVSPGQFTLILIGKDGGVKLKTESPVSLVDVFSIIDAMPMRQREIQERTK